MDFKKIFVVILFLTFAMLISSVSAENDTSIADNINVTFSHKIYEHDNASVNVSLPANAKGSIKAVVDDVEIYNENITNSSLKIPITIPKSSQHLIVSNRQLDYTTHSIYLFYNDLEIKMNHTFKLMKFSPDRDYSCSINEILKDDESGYVSLIFPSSANGSVKIFIDDDLKEELISKTYTFLNINNFNHLSLGNHTLRVEYSGDDYYHGSNSNFTFEVVDMLIDIPQNIVLDHNDCVSGKIITNKGGVVKIYVDGNVFSTLLLDKNGEFLQSLFDLSCGNHLVEVTYDSNNFHKSKKVYVNVSYDISIFKITKFIYGEDNQVSVYVPYDLNKNLIKITINGEKYDFSMDESGDVDVDISNLPAGNYTFTIEYAGDLKYSKKTESYNFTVEYGIVFWDFDENKIVLRLPDDAVGNLEVYIDGRLYKSLKLSNGCALITINAISTNKHTLKAVYTASDYKVLNFTTSFIYFPIIKTPITINKGDNKFISVYASDGVVVFYVGKKQYKVDVKNGVAKLALKNLKKGEYYIDMLYTAQDGFNISLYTYVNVIIPNIKVKAPSKVLYNSKYKFKVYIKGKLAKKTKITVRIANHKFKVKTNKKGIASIKLSKNLSPKTYKVKIYYKHFKTSQKLLISDIIQIKVINKNDKVILKAVLLNKLKGKKITFKVNKKTFIGKTNKNGVVSLVIDKNHDKKINYKVTYLKNTVKDSFQY